MFSGFAQWGCPEFSRVSLVMGCVSSIAWLVAQIPQQITNYRTKNVEGISVGLLVLWFLGDIASFIGCVLTHQLPFQYYLALYFIYNDFILCGQWVYYTYYYQARRRFRIEKLQGLPLDSEAPSSAGIMDSPDSSPKQAAAESPASGSASKMKAPGLARVAAAGATLVGSTRGLPIPVHAAGAVAMASATDSESVGRVVAWMCTCIYLSSRLPQLYKNWTRKSVEGISPLLFASALIGNVCYTASILSSCDFIFAEDQAAFLLKELPYILGSGGTFVFDIFYFYQRWIYGKSEGAIYNDSQIEAMVEAELTENTPLIA